MKIVITGLDNLRRILQNMPDIAEKAAHDELNHITQNLKGKAQRLAPVDMGDLKGAAFAEVIGLDGVVGFAEEYATIQHEGIGFKHPKGGQAKYLEEPYKANVDKYVNDLKTAVRKAVEKPK